MACACDALSPLPVEEKAIPFPPCLSRKRRSWDYGMRLRFPFPPACRGKGNRGVPGQSWEHGVREGLCGAPWGSAGLRGLEFLAPSGLGTSLPLGTAADLKCTGSFAPTNPVRSLLIHTCLIRTCLFMPALSDAARLRIAFPPACRGKGSHGVPAIRFSPCLSRKRTSAGLCRAPWLGCARSSAGP